MAPTALLRESKDIFTWKVNIQESIEDNPVAIVVSL